MKKSKLSNKHRKPSKVLTQAAFNFMADSSALMFSRSLRNILFDYISQNKDCLPVDFDITMNDFNNLFAFLDAIEDEFSKEL